jgi:DNA polymerase-3 subunit epsilon
LKAAVKFYCKRDLEDAHSSDADTVACKDVFLAQLEMYEDLGDKPIDEIVEFSKMDNRVDFAGKIVKDENNRYLYNFGKAKGQEVKSNRGFGEWMLNNDFTQNTKKVVRDILYENENEPF